MSYQSTRNVRRENRTLVGRFRGGKLAPVLATAVRGNEGGMLSQQITLELDPIAGRMITPIRGEFISVFVPVQAMHALKFPDADYAGLTDVIREKLLSGAPLFGLEAEGQISRRCGVNPRSIGGNKQVSEMIRLAHACAVNHLRRQKHVDATLLTAASGGVTPALISQTILERMNGVLDPDDRINGQVALELQGTAPVHWTARGAAHNEAGGALNTTHRTITVGATEIVQTGVADGRYSAPSKVYADLNNVLGGGISLVDLYNAETKDKLVRQMREIVDANPQYGQEMVLRWAHGLSVDPGKVCTVIHREEQTFGRSMAAATDTAGVNNDVQRSDMVLAMQFTVPVPRTELGGVIITFATLKPDETVSSQPHPFLSDTWGAENFVADELALDPVPVTIRELDSDCTSAQESTVAFYTGLNALKQTYVSYGLSRALDPNTVENKTAVWQLEVPLSVTPDTILYPDDLSHFPFADQLAEVCTYVVTSNLVLQTPMIIGPTPVEELAIIDDEDLFEEEA